MKSTNILWASLAAMALLFSGCNDDETESGVDESLPCPTDLTYDELLSESGTIVLNWKKGETASAGATSYTVQLADSVGGTVDQYNGLSSVVQADTNMTESFTVSDRTLYYARVRANYTRSRFSKWVYITLGQDNKQYAVESGYGYVDESLPTIDLMSYDSENSSETSATFTVDASTAQSASAESLVILMDSKKSSVSDELNYESPSATSTTFSGLTQNTQYRLFGRASYTVSGYTVYSPWFQASQTNEDGTTYSVVEIGTGFVAEVPPAVKFDYATSSALYFSWSSEDFANVAADKATPWTISLYKDEACSDLVVSWSLGANPTDGITSGDIYDGKQTRFLFSGLEPETKYYLTVTDENRELTSDPVEGETLPFSVVEISDSKASVGDIILAEDFSELIWGGDLVYGYPGYSTTRRGSLTSFEKATGSSPADHYKFVKPSNEVGLFNTMRLAVANSRLSTWGAIFEGSATSYICGRPGFLKLGASSYMGEIVTPELSSLPGTSTVKLTFKAARYGTDPRTGKVDLITSATVGTDNGLTVNGSSTVYSFNAPASAGEWEEYSVEIPNVTPTSRIGIGASREDGSSAGAKQHRMYIDDIQIQLLSTGGTTITLEAPVISDATAASDKITVTWGAVDNASGYSVEYKKSSDTDWTVAGSTTETTYDITGLEASTSYDIRVQATASGDNTSDYSEVKTVSTTAAPTSLDINLVKAEANEIVVRWSISDFADAATDREDYYQFGIFNDAACTDAVVFYKGASDAGYTFNTASKLTGYRTGKDEYDESPAFVFAGLDPSTTYYVKVVDVTKDITGTASFSTTASDVVDITTLTAGSAAAGSVILNEDFGVLTWGGDLEDNAVGVSTKNRATYESFSMPSGEVNYTTTASAGDYYIVGAGTEMGMFNTVNKALQSTRLYSWGWRAVEDNIKAICARPGCVKLGAGGNSGIILTPALSALQGTATIKVTVTAGCYIDVGATQPADALNGEVTVFSSSDIQTFSSYSSNYIPIATAASSTTTFSVSATRGYNDYTVTISGVSPTDVIGIGAPTDSYNRLIIDNIKIEVVSYE